MSRVVRRAASLAGAGMMGLGLPSKASARLDTMLRILASDQDGEVVSAARAIGRVLTSHKLSFHELAAAVSAAPPIGPAGHQPRRPPVYPQPHPAEENGFEDEDAPEEEPPSTAKLTRARQLAWARLILDRLQIDDKDAVVLLDASRKLDGPSYYLNRMQARVLDRLIRRAWRVGLRP